MPGSVVPLAMFCYYGVFFTNFCFTKKVSFCERFKLRPVLSVKNTPFTFFAFLLPLHVNFSKKKSSPHSWGVKKPSCKNGYVFGENWQGNPFPKLDTFLLIFRSCYNFAIVQWPWNAQLLMFSHVDASCTKCSSKLCQQSALCPVKENLKGFQLVQCIFTQPTAALNFFSQNICTPRI